MKRILMAAVFGGVAIFIWGFLSHAVLPLGQVGIKVLPDEAAVMSSMQSTITAPGFYFFPGMDPKQQSDPAVQAAWLEKYKAGPRGVVIYQPTGEQPMSPTQLAMQQRGMSAEAAHRLGLLALERMVQLAATVRAFDDCFRIATVVAVVGVVPALLLRRSRGGGGGHHEAAIEIG